MFGRYEDWGLQAVVGASNKIEKMENIQGQCGLGIWGLANDDQNFILGFSDLMGNNKPSSSMGWGDGLETLYNKPFNSGHQDYIFTDLPNSISPNSSFSSTPKEVKNEVEEIQVKQGTDQEVIKAKGNSQVLDQSSCSTLATAYTPRFKRRKNQQKRVVTHVKAEDYLSSDMWAWRKYGQKPIKGSPYPRSYYRCSSMKGCQARKQVEQSCTDPEVYIVTYTAEHCHIQPTRRNSLAGTVRNKFPTTPKNPITAALTTANNNSPPLAPQEEISSKSPPLNESSEEDISERYVKQENLDEELRTVELGYNSNGDPFWISDFLMNDDFFSGLEDLDGPEL